jgi:hypothetical protein
VCSKADFFAFSQHWAENQASPPTWGRIWGGRARVSGEEARGGCTWSWVARNWEGLRENKKAISRCCSPNTSLLTEGPFLAEALIHPKHCWAAVRPIL